MGWSMKGSRVVCLVFNFVFTAELENVYPGAFPSICPVKNHAASLADDNERMEYSLIIV